MIFIIVRKTNLFIMHHFDVYFREFFRTQIMKTEILQLPLKFRDFGEVIGQGIFMFKIIKSVRARVAKGDHHLL